MEDAVVETRKLVAEKRAPKAFDELKGLVRALKARFEFSLARQLLELVGPEYREVGVPDRERRNRTGSHTRSRVESDEAGRDDKWSKQGQRPDPLSCNFNDWTGDNSARLAATTQANGNGVDG